MMLDTTTYLSTQDNPGGPILRLIDREPHELCEDYSEHSEGEAEPTSLGRPIGGAVSIALLGATVIYFYLAV